MKDDGRETQPLGTFLDHDRLDHAIVGLAAAQHGVVALSQLVDLGLSAGAVRKRAADARLHRIHRSVYALTPLRLLGREARWMAAVLACGPGAILSHQSAAALHELRGTNRAKIDVMVPHRSSRHHARIDVHRSLVLSEEDVSTIRGIPCTSIARTLLDLAAILGRRAVERALDQAEICGVLNLRALGEQLERNPKHRGAYLLRAVLDSHYIGRTPTWNEFEERFLGVVRSAGLPDPEVNAWIVLPDGEPAIRADFVWRDRRVVVETDGRATHLTRQAFEHDRRRDQRLAVGGWRPIRVTWRQLVENPAQVREVLVALVRL